MGPVLGTAIFVVIWWVVLFAVLPWRVRGQHEDDDAVVVPGADPGAPTKPMLWRKVGITTAIAAVLWLGVFALTRHPPAFLIELLGRDETPPWMPAPQG